jgi:hypothetical protein
MVTKRPPLSPLNASRSEQDAYERKAAGLTSTGTNMGSATRNRITPPTTQVPQPPSTPGTAPVEGSDQMAGEVQTPSSPVLSASVLDIGACKVGDQISFSVLSVQNGQVSLGNPLVLPERHLVAAVPSNTGHGSDALQSVRAAEPCTGRRSK